MYPPALIGIGVVVVACVILSAASRLALRLKAFTTARAEREQARFDRASAKQREATVQGTVRELGIALQTVNEDWVSDLCRRLRAYGAMGRAAPALALALEELSPALRLCAVRGLRWGHGATGTPPDQRPRSLLCGVVTSGREATHLRVAAAVALGSGGGYFDCRRNLRACLGVPDGDVRAAVIARCALARKLALNSSTEKVL